jgi:signal peptidase I
LTLAFAAGLIFFFDQKGIQFFLVPSASMEPTLVQSDYIGGFNVEPGELRRGDIVVFTSGRKDDFYVKRIVGLSGDTLAIRRGFVYINGHKLDEPYVTHRGGKSFKRRRIPVDHVFIMGDNRTNSVDSRKFGPVSTSQIEARISFIYSPINRMGGVE